jgi:hypothetical protein
MQVNNAMNYHVPRFGNTNRVNMTNTPVPNTSYSNNSTNEEELKQQNEALKTTNETLRKENEALKRHIFMLNGLI